MMLVLIEMAVVVVRLWVLLAAARVCRQLGSVCAAALPRARRLEAMSAQCHGNTRSGTRGTPRCSRRRDIAVRAVRTAPSAVLQRGHRRVRARVAPSKLLASPLRVWRCVWARAGASCSVAFCGALIFLETQLLSVCEDEQVRSCASAWRCGWYEVVCAAAVSCSSYSVPIARVHGSVASCVAQRAAAPVRVDESRAGAAGQRDRHAHVRSFVASCCNASDCLFVCLRKSQI